MNNVQQNPCYMCDSAYRRCIVENANNFSSYMEHFLKSPVGMKESRLVYANEFSSISE